MFWWRWLYHLAFLLFYQHSKRAVFCQEKWENAKGNKITQANFLRLGWWAACPRWGDSRHYKLRSLFARALLNDGAKALVRLLTICSDQASWAACLTSAGAPRCAAVLQTQLRFWCQASRSYGSVVLLCSLEVLKRGLTDNVSEGILQKLVLEEPLVAGTVGKEIWEKFRWRFISHLSNLSISSTEIWI